MLIRIFISCVMFLISFSTLSRVDLDELRKKMEYLPPVRLSKFVDVTHKSFSKKYRIYDGNLVGISPTTNEEYDIPFIYYKTKQKGKRPLVVIFPVILGVTVIETYMARYLARYGINVVIATSAEDISDPERPTTEIDDVLIRTSASVRALLDYMLERPEIDQRKVGAFGCSFGGILSLMLTGIDSRIKSTVAFVGGGNLAEIMARSDQVTVREYREARMAAEGFETEDEFCDHLQRTITIDPMYFAGDVPTDNILMIISDQDGMVPTDNQFDLWEAFGRPPHHIVQMSHVMAVISSMYSKQRTRSFFNQSWNNLYGVERDDQFSQTDQLFNQEKGPDDDELEMAIEQLSLIIDDSDDQ